MATEKPDSPAQYSDQDAAPSVWRARRNLLIGAAIVLLLLVSGTAVILASQSKRTLAGGTPSASSPSTQPTSSAPTNSANPTSSPPVDPAVPAKPVPIEQAAAIKPGLTAEITKFEAVQGIAKTPGEVSRPSVRITVTITNGTSAEASLLTTVITAYYGADQTPANELSSPGGSPLPTKVAAGQSVTGVYLFSIPEDQRNFATIEVDYSVKVQPLIFQGPIPL
jgi:hypothetical protein